MEPRQRESNEPTLDQLERLAGSADVGDRAFAASALLLREGGDARHLRAIYDRIRATAREQHADVHALIRRGELTPAMLDERLQALPIELHDHFIEEVLDVAYPPLPAHSRARDVTRHSPSAFAEIRFMLEHSRLGRDQVLVDLGSGFGKVVLLTALLTGARAHGIDLDPQLVEQARAAASRLSLERAGFTAGDIREVPLPEADVYYLFIPFVGSAELVARLAPIAAQRHIVLFSQALELEPTPWLRATGKASYWLRMYESALKT